MARRGDQGPDLAAPDEAAPAQLDALEPPGACPATDGGRREPDVGCRQDLGGLGQGDPVRWRGHGQSAAGSDAAGAAGLTLVSAAGAVGSALLPLSEVSFESFFLESPLPESPLPESPLPEPSPLPPSLSV